MSTTKDLHNLISVAVGTAITALTTATTTAGTSVDCQSSDGLEFIMQVGGYTNGTATLLITESDDNSVFTTAATASLTGAASGTALAAAGVSSIGYIGSKRYVKASIVTTGGTVGLTAGVTAVKYGLRLRGVVDPVGVDE